MKEQNNTPTPLMEEFLIMVDATSAMLNTAEDPDPEHPEPMIAGIELANEASDMVEQIREHYEAMRKACERAYKYVNGEPDLDGSDELILGMDLRAVLKVAGVDTNALDAEIEKAQNEEQD